MWVNTYFCVSLQPMRYIYIILLALCACSPGTNSGSHTAGNTGADSVYRYETFRNTDGTYGYNIYDSSNILIHQANVPALPGNKGFADSGKAMAVAQFVIERIHKIGFPPTVQAYEVDSIIGIK